MPKRLPDHLTVRVEPAPDLWPVTGDYVRQWWTSQLGPTAISLLQVLGADDYCVWRADDLYDRLGIGRRMRVENPNPVTKAFDRLEAFGFVTRTGDEVVVSSHLPTLSASIIDKFSLMAIAKHDAMVVALTTDQEV